MMNIKAAICYFIFGGVKNEQKKVIIHEPVGIHIKAQQYKLKVIVNKAS